MISAAKPKDVLIEPRFKKDKTASGLLYLPEQSRERCTQGIVKYIGSDVQDVKIGDRVGFSGYTGSLARVGNELLIIMPEKEIDFIFTLDDPDYGLFIEEELDGDNIRPNLNLLKESYPYIKEEDLLPLLLLCWDMAPFKKVTYPEMMKHVEQKMQELPVGIERKLKGDMNRSPDEN